MPKLIDRTGHTYGRLSVVRRVGGPASKGRRTKWLCRCECGERTVVTGHELASGDTTSCGCLRREILGTRARTHGMTRTPTYRSWQAAKDRCHNPNNKKFSAYGGVGVTMCDRWRDSFDAFLADMGVRPPHMTLDRIDNAKGYEPGNVRWATAKQQTDNRGNARAYRWRGTWMTRKDIAATEGIPYTSLGKALKNHNTVQAAVAHVRSRLGRSGVQNLRSAL